MPRQQTRQLISPGERQCSSLTTLAALVGAGAGVALPDRGVTQLRASEPGGAF